MSLVIGKKILVVEDEPIVAMLIEDMLADLGACAVGPISNLAKALDVAANGEFDAAILDFNLNGERTGEVARRLHERGIPFVFATGYGSTGDERLGEAAILEKPFQIGQMEVALTKAFAGTADG